MLFSIDRVAPYCAVAVLAAVPSVVFAGQDVAPPAVPAPPPAAEVTEPTEATEGDEAKGEPAETSPRPITPEDYGQWESLGGGFFGGSGTLSPDARWLAYSVNRVNSENELRVRMLATEEVKVYEYGRSPAFSSDGEWLAFSIGVSAAEREKGKPAPPKLGLLNLSDGEESEIENVGGFSFSDDGRFLLMRRGSGDGAALVIRDLDQNVDTSFGNVSSYRMADDSSLLAMVIKVDGDVGNGVQIFDTKRGTLRTIDSHAAKYQNLSWRKDSTDLVVLREMNYEKDEDVSHTVLVWRNLGGDRVPRAIIWDHLEDDTMPEDRFVSASGGVRFSEDGAAVYVGLKEWETKPKALEEDNETEGDAEAKKNGAKGDKSKKSKGKSLRETLKKPSNVEVWHARDINIMPRQKLTERRDRRRTETAILWLDGKQLVVLANELTEEVRPLDDPAVAIGLDHTPYEELTRFGPTLNDLYRIDATTGEREKILEGVKYFYASDPTSRSLIFVRDDALHSYNLKTGLVVNLTENADAAFINQEISNLTDQKPPYGVGAWTEDGERVILRDRYDMYIASPDGSTLERLTNGAEKQIRHRRLVLDREKEEFIELDQPMLVSLYGDRTKHSGFGIARMGEPVETLIYEDESIGRLARAEDSDVYTYVSQRFDDAPDIFLARRLAPDSFDAAKQVTELNPFQSDFQWGRGELIDYTSQNGDALQGALYYPANYEPGKQYPMIVDIYELRSQGLHRYPVPSERSAYNAAVFTAEGFFVYTPDIVYRPQNPGLSAVECVVPAVEAVLATGMVDPDGVGLVGHSWGAYQTAFIVTQTDLFAAGIAGAPLTNMMSMSMSIYWNSGESDTKIFHESQGRMDRPFWQDVDTYIANSPIFSIDDMETPLMIAFGTEDGAVDFNQGVEMYNAARLAGKQFVMLVYPGENHGLRKKENQVDYHYRILEWFGHYLRGDDADEWVTEGQSWLDRQKEIADDAK